jgi:hypothetical protein
MNKTFILIFAVFQDVFIFSQDLRSHDRIVFDHVPIDSCSTAEYVIAQKQ